MGIPYNDLGKVILQIRIIPVKPMRCYLMYKNGGEDYTGARMMTRAATADEQLPETIKVRMVSANGDVTAIGTLHTQTGEVVMDGWYTLDEHHRLSKAQTSLVLHSAQAFFDRLRQTDIIFLGEIVRGIGKKF